MNVKTKLISLVGTSCLLAFATAAPALADTKPCCTNNGQYFQSSPTTCRNNGGYVVDQQYCGGGYYPGTYGGYSRSRLGPNFAITLGNITFAYTDGYYDNNRRWHAWRSNDERNWYQQNHRGSYYGMRHDRDNDRHRRDWRDGKRQDWHN